MFLLLHVFTARLKNDIQTIWITGTHLKNPCIMSVLYLAFIYGVYLKYEQNYFLKRNKFNITNTFYFPYILINT